MPESEEVSKSVCANAHIKTAVFEKDVKNTGRADSLDKKQILISAAVAMACFMPPFIGEATNIALPEMLSSFGLNAGMADYWNRYGWILTVYLLASTVFLIPAARLADRIGHKRIFCAGTALFGIGSLGVGLAGSAETVILMRAVEGTGNALMFAAAIALVAAAVGPQCRGTAIGIAMTGIFAGQLAGPLLAGLLTDVFGWQVVYLFLVPVSLAALLTALLTVPKDSPGRVEPFDPVGTGLFMTGMALFLYGFSKLPGKVPLILTAIGLFVLAVFFADARRREKTGGKPLIPAGLLLENRRFSFNNAANLLYYIAVYSMGSLVSLYMTNVWQITDALPRAIIVTTQGLILVLFTVVSGRSYDRRLPKNAFWGGAVLMAAGILSLFLTRTLSGGLTADPMTLTAAVVSAAVISFGIGLAVLAAIRRKAPHTPEKYAAAAGLLLIIPGLILLLISGTEVNILNIIASQALLGVGIAVFVTPNSTAIMNAVTAEEYSTASGMLSTMRMLGMAVSIGIVSILKNIFLTNALTGTAAYNEAFLQMMHGAVLASIVVLIAAVAFSLAAEKNDERPNKTH